MLSFKRIFGTTCRFLRLQKRLSKDKSFASAVYYLQQKRCCSAEIIPPPHAEGAEKEYSVKIKNIVEDISKLTLIEVADLNDLLKKTLNIKDAPMMAMGAMPAAAAVAKKFVEGVPQILRSDISKDEAESLKKTITEAGGEVEID